MRNMMFAQAIEDALAYAMEKDSRIMVLGEDVHMLRVNLYSCFGDADGLMLTAIEESSPVIFCEHKLLADYWRDYLGSGGRDTVSYNVPEQGQQGAVPDTEESIPLGKAKILRNGSDITIASVGVGVHRSLEAAVLLDKKNIRSTVIDLRSVAPLAAECICKSVAQTKRLLVVDEDYEQFGLSGEIAACVLENEINFKYGRLCTKVTIPYSRKLEEETLPSPEKIVNKALSLMKD